MGAPRIRRCRQSDRKPHPLAPRRRPPRPATLLAGLESALWSVWRDPTKALDQTETQQRLLEQLIVAISRLARPAESQIAYLEALGLGTTADELALELDDVAEAALAAPGLLSQRQRSLVSSLDAQLREMSGPEHTELWSRQALRSSPAWSEIRTQARVALRELHAERVAPA